MSNELKPPYLATITETDNEICKECKNPILPNTIIFYFEDDSIWCNSCLEGKVRAYMEIAGILGDDIPTEKKEKMLGYFT